MEGDEVFFSGVCDLDWYENLNRNGSCLQLLDLLRGDCTLIHKLGPEDITVLHKGVQHGCVALVRYILVDMFDDQGHCKCSLHGTGCPVLTREMLLRKACSYGSTAVNMAVVSGSPKMVVLLNWAIKMSERLVGTLAEELSSLEGEKRFGYMQWVTIRSGMMQKRSKEEILTEITSDTESGLPAPDVKDEDISILEPSDYVVNRKVISVIEGVLEDPGEIYKDLMAVVMEKCRMNVDFEFVPVAQVILHYLVSVGTDIFRRIFWEEFDEFRRVVLEKVIKACNSDDGCGESMVKTLFNILDPRGRTILHARPESESDYLRSWSLIAELLMDVSPSVKDACRNAKDGAGRTLLHHYLIHEYSFEFDKSFFLRDFNESSKEDFPPSVNWTERLSSPQDEMLNDLKRWCFPHSRPIKWNSFHLAVIFNSSFFVSLLRGYFRHHGLNSNTLDIRATFGEFEYSAFMGRPIYLAAALGRADILDYLLWHHTKFHSSCDTGLGNGGEWDYPAIHVAAKFARVEAIQTILKFPVYDPIIQFNDLGTALHHLLSTQPCLIDVDYLHATVLCHLLPNSKDYDRLKNDFISREPEKINVPSMFSANEVSCINLLLQGGIDIWTPHSRTKELPGPGPMANDEARKWWYDKVVQEVVSVKTSVSYAANATSVVAALVATASFIGPLQPPLGYADSDGYVRTNESPVRVYLVCNSLSFFFSIASILMAVLPAIPMPKESLYDELLRSQRCLKGAALMLLIAIMCILISFSSASLAVVSSEWRERQMVVACVVCGGVICVVVLVIYVIRMLRMVFHRNDWFRRKFAKYMYF